MRRPMRLAGTQGVEPVHPEPAEPDLDLHLAPEPQGPARTFPLQHHRTRLPEREHHHVPVGHPIHLIQHHLHPSHLRRPAHTV